MTIRELLHAAIAMERAAGPVNPDALPVPSFVDREIWLADPNGDALYPPGVKVFALAPVHGDGFRLIPGSEGGVKHPAVVNPTGTVQPPDAAQG